tara:strand:- start:252 stop:1889 length:1638 start_codon:yes stop_codon:yes gene_type:complete
MKNTNTQTEDNSPHESVVRFDTTPDAYNLYHVIMPSGFGYDMTDALGDLIDNALDAKATEVCTVFKKAPGRISEGGAIVEAICIIDNGHGMSAPTLEASLKFSTKTPHAPGALGKFGAGGTAASFGIARKKIVYTKEANKPLIVGWLNLDSFQPNGTFDNTGARRQGTLADIEYFKTLNQLTEEEYEGSSGTIIELHSIREEHSSTAKKYAGDFRKYCAETYYKFLSNGVNMKTMLTRVGQESITHKISPHDPLLHDDKESLSYAYSETVVYPDPLGEKHSIDLRYSILGPAASRGDLIESQGIYASRNERMILKHSSMGRLWKKSGARLRAGRMEINFPESLDSEVGLTTTKNKLVLSPDLRDFLKPKIDKFRAKIMKEAQTPCKTKAELEKEEEKLGKQIHKHGAPLGLPEVQVPPTSGGPNPDAGRGPDKKKRKEKDPNNKSKSTVSSHAKFNFVHVSPTVPTSSQWWYEVGDDMSITVFINDKHDFIIQNYTEGAEEVRRIIRHFMTAEVLTQITFQDNSAAPTIFDQLSRNLTNLHNLIQ